MQDFAKRIALGTAQLGLSYGINNTAGQPSLEQAADLLRTAQALGITLLDTAAAYGDSEARLGKLLPAIPPPRFAIVTKIGAGPAAEVATALAASLARLEQDKVYGILFHDFAGQQQWPEAWQVLQEAQMLGRVQRIGVSLYHPWQAEWLLDKQLPVSLVQLPLNVLDQRFVPLLPRLVAAGIEVHARSAFLQGLLLRDPQQLPTFFSPLRGKLLRLRAVAAQHQLPVEVLLLLFAASFPQVSRVVIGVDSVENLQQNVRAGQFHSQFLQAQPVLSTFAEPHDTFILPYTWPR
ncbi:aldo/keto reductase [Hymenobacter lutimineralis]|uniref:Aldo/keto reductase n=1 Tax=Hymenobacter lutimineralis TaxID=2606448 RepID=A0A5D6V6J8_9BACT|nr:aldo/keto reductase [Hymenobacter lutimineralis]TYZ10548.1 aldo/keto reductase [Hymenobacter lutimineralis]